MVIALGVLWPAVLGHLQHPGLPLALVLRHVFLSPQRVLDLGHCHYLNHCDHHILLCHGHTAISGDSVAMVTGGSLSSPGQLTSAVQLSVVCAEASPASTGLCGSTEIVPKARKAPQHLEAPRAPQSPAPRGHCSPERLRLQDSHKRVSFDL